MRRGGGREEGGKEGERRRGEGGRGRRGKEEGRREGGGREEEKAGLLVLSEAAEHFTHLPEKPPHCRTKENFPIDRWLHLLR